MKNGNKKKQSAPRSMKENLIRLLLIPQTIKVLLVNP